MQRFSVALWNAIACIAIYARISWSYKYYAPTGLFKGYMKEIPRLARNDNTIGSLTHFVMLS